MHCNATTSLAYSSETGRLGQKFFISSSSKGGHNVSSETGHFRWASACTDDKVYSCKKKKKKHSITDVSRCYCMYRASLSPIKQNWCSKKRKERKALKKNQTEGSQILKKLTNLTNSEWAGYQLITFCKRQLWLYLSKLLSTTLTPRNAEKARERSSARSFRYSNAQKCDKVSSYNELFHAIILNDSSSN